MSTATSSKKFTPPELARRYGVEPCKVIAWIRSGELRALNVATRATGRPRYLIGEEDIARFEQGRSTKRGGEP